MCFHMFSQANRTAMRRFPSPTKEIVSPFTKLFLSKDKNTIKALSFGAPEALSCGTDCTKYCAWLQRDIESD